jgi:pimeloyl-ACP methyl ester carboxylesterase
MGERATRVGRSGARAVAGWVVVALLAVGAAGCTTKKDELKPASKASFASAPCPTPYYPDAPERRPGPEVSCGYLTVPENRAQPDGRQIKIAVARLKAASAQPKPDPVVWLTGGPGSTGLLAVDEVVKLKLNADRDFIFPDQRGTFHDDPFLSCPEFDAATHEAVGLVTSDPATRRRRTEAVRACRTRLAGAGYDLSAYNTTENAADIADLRTALGLKEWNVYGVSYGTDLALQMVRDHPQGIRSLALDSLAPPQINNVEGLWPAAASSYKAMFDACEAQPACNTTYPNLRAEFTATVARLDREPLTVQVPAAAATPATTVVFDGYQAASVLDALTLFPAAAVFPAVPAMLHALAAGDGLPMAKVLLALLNPPGFNGWGLFWGVFCREQAGFTDPQSVQAAAKAALPDFPDRVLSTLPEQDYLSRVFDDCATWDVGRADPRVRTPARSDVPTLLMNGTFDGTTPAASAAAAAKTLPHSRTLLFPGLGHDIVGQSECAQTVTAAFLDQPSGGYDTSCVDKITVLPFTTG